MKVIHKDAAITNTDDDFPGSFEVVLSAPTRDRDGDTLLPEQWKQPLPDHITFDADHLMSVAGTVGSGKPRIDEKTGNLVVSGTYSSLPRAQEVRTLVKEGHINRTSVAFMSEKTQKDGRTTVTRELLNGAFVAVPSNREAVVLESKGLKAGARNSKSDAEHIQAIHDHAIALGAAAATKSFVQVELKTTVIETLARFELGDITADEALTLIRDATAPSDEPGDAVPDPDEDADSGAPVSTAGEAVTTASTAADDRTPEEDSDTDRKKSLAAQWRLRQVITNL